MSVGRDYLAPLVKQGDLTAARVLGQAYLEGPANFRDSRLAQRYLQQAIDGGDIYAHAALGQALIQPDSILEQDIPRAEKLLKAAAQQGHLGSKTTLGREYLSGERLAYQPERGADYLLEAAHNGNPDAYTELIKTFLRANGLNNNRANQDQARQWLDQVIQSNDDLALKTLYQLLMEAPAPPREKHTSGLISNALINIEAPKVPKPPQE